MEAFMEAKCTSLKQMSICEASLSTLQINKDLFLNFFKAQAEKFYIWFSMCEEADWNRTIELRDELFDEHFELTDSEVIKQEKKRVAVCYGDISWYYTLRAG
uniref:RGS domain-containing protein n=1 Tax=Panagrellus redivivus TaxID=6233 RepID=A0A7E4V5W9_PANRE